MRKIIYTRADGCVSVVHPVRNTFPELETLTDAEVEQRAWDRLPADAINPQLVDASAIPTDRSKRLAWRQRGATVEVDAAAVAALHDSDAIAAIDGIDKTQFKQLFNLQNRLRVLEAKAPITFAVYRKALIDEWKAHGE